VTVVAVDKRDEIVVSRHWGSPEKIKKGALRAPLGQSAKPEDSRELPPL
jgi:hypothetical protein